MRHKARTFAKKVLLGFSVFALTVAGLEVVFRVALPVPAPRLLRDRIYVNVLPLVNGRPTDRGSVERDGIPLPAQPEPDEVRIFVFGESSIEGSPWGHAGSPPTMLYDQLAAAFPTRAITVVNMGRVSAFTMDTYYHMLSVRRFKPDYIIIYTGVNNRFDVDDEMCWPATHPRAYGAWRFLVEHSHMLWSVRALFPERLQWYRTETKAMRVVGANKCSNRDANFAWTDILTKTAQDAGAEVIITSPLRSALAALEFRYFAHTDLPLREYLAQMPETYRAALACRLTKGCDFAALISVTARDPQIPHPPEHKACGEGRQMQGNRRDRPEAHYPYVEDGLREGDAADVPGSTRDCRLDGGLGDPPMGEAMAAWSALASLWRRGRTQDPWMGEIVAAWESAAAKHGAEFIDFRGMLRDASPHRVLGPPMIVDDVHLSLEGYWLLSNLWFQAIRWRLEGQPAKPVTLGADPDVSAYVRALEPIGDVLVGNGHRHLKVGMLLFALNMLIPAAEDQHDDSARLAVGWIRTVAGLPADLPPELQAKLGEFDPENLWEYAKPPGSTRPGTPPPPNRP